MSRGGDEEVNLMGGGCSGVCTIQGTMVNTDGNGGEISNSGERQRLDQERWVWERKRNNGFERVYKVERVSLDDGEERVTPGCFRPSLLPFPSPPQPYRLCLHGHR